MLHVYCTISNCAHHKQLARRCGTTSYQVHSVVSVGEIVSVCWGSQHTHKTFARYACEIVRLGLLSTEYCIHTHTQRFNSLQKILICTLQIRGGAGGGGVAVGRGGA
jgi:hypothetical protein